MSILNYTTKIPAHKTVAEIEQVLLKMNVTHIGKTYEENEIISLTFAVSQEGQMLNFLLPCNHDGVLKVLQNDKNVPKPLKTKEHAMRVAWRIKKDWLIAQVAIVEAQMASATEIFLPYMLVEHGTNTLYNSLRQNNFQTDKLLN